MSKKFLLSLSYLSLCKFFWTRTENRVIENRVMENRVKRGITVPTHKSIYHHLHPSTPCSILELIVNWSETQLTYQQFHEIFG